MPNYWMLSALKELSVKKGKSNSILTELLERDALEHCINRKVYSQRS